MYFITCFDDRWIENTMWFCEEGEPPRDERGNVRYHEQAAQRIVGYYPDKADALAAVRRNAGDLHENLFTLCVVEFVPPGLYGPTGERDQTWFAWTRTGGLNLHQWSEISPPTYTQGFLGFAIG